MTVDAAVNSHPIVVELTSPDQINEAFDVISYHKVRHSLTYRSTQGFICRKNIAVPNMAVS